MRLIEIEDGISINTDSIERIVKTDDPNIAEIATHHRKFRVMMPYETLVSLIKQEDLAKREVYNEERTRSVMEKLDKVLPGIGHFAG